MKSESFRSLRGGERCGAAALDFGSVCEGVSGIFRESVNAAAPGVCWSQLGEGILHD